MHQREHRDSREGFSSEEEMAYDYANDPDRFKEGDEVMVHGYPGRILREYLPDMYEVRLESGDLCTDVCDITRRVVSS